MTGKPELLAPAGSWEALVAAVENGADAVYLGGKAFNARQFAGNFDDETLKKGIEYAHVRGANVYLTLNTLVADQEMQEALELANTAYCLGIDGMIVQDLGFAGKLRKELPGLNLHASTQMTIYNVEGVRTLEKMGFKRVVLARECSIQEIKSIVESTSAEIEVFVHGALCVSYSGQCLMSSIIGGRSGNRGKCAQPCRLKYEISDEGEHNKRDSSSYIMSPKDLSSVEYLPELTETGIASLKIEGRMKSPEYVGVVVEIYRKYLDLAFDRKGYTVRKEDLSDLLQIFNRGGFTSGYLKGKPGNRLISFEKPKNWGIPVGEVVSYDAKGAQAVIKLSERVAIGDGIEVWNHEDESPGTVVFSLKVKGIPVEEALPGQLAAVKIRGHIHKGNLVYRTSRKELLERSRQTFGENVNRKKIPVSGKITASLGSPIEMRVWDERGIQVEARGTAHAEKAVSRALSREKLLEHATKTGSTPFVFDELEIMLEEGIALPVSEINAVRREALSQLAEARASRYPERCGEGMPALRGENALQTDRGDTYAGKVPFEKVKDKTGLSVYLFDMESAGFLNGLELERIYLPFSGWIKDKQGFEAKVKELKLSAAQVFLYFPPITRGNYDFLIRRNIEEIAQLPVDGFMIGNPGMLEHRGELHNKIIAGDISLNVFNAASARLLQQKGLQSVTLSPELTLGQIREIMQGFPMEYEAVIHGKLPVMTSEYCPVGSTRGGFDGNKKCGLACGKEGKSCRKDKYYLKDRTGAFFPVIRDSIDCRSMILNSNDMFLARDIERVINLKPALLRINILDEGQKEIQSLIRLYRGLLQERNFVGGAEYREFCEKMKEKGYTKGHFFRGV